MDKPSIKPGWKSSEFWLTAVSFLFSGLYLVGLLDSNNQKEDLIAETSRGVEALVLIMGQLAVLFRYIKGRSEIKKIWWSNSNNEKTNTVNSRSKKNVKPKSNKNRSRKINK